MSIPFGLQERQTSGEFKVAASSPGATSAVDSLEAEQCGLPSNPRVRILSSQPDWVEILLPCQLDLAEHIQSFLTWMISDLSEEVRDSVGSALHELLFNAIEWGGKLDPQKHVRIAFLRGERLLLFRIADPGSGFRFKDLAHAALNNPPDKPSGHMEVREKNGLRPGGFGLMMVRAAAAELIFNESHNEVVFVKYLA